MLKDIEINMRKFTVENSSEGFSMTMLWLWALIIIYYSWFYKMNLLRTIDYLPIIVF